MTNTVYQLIRSNPVDRDVVRRILTSVGIEVPETCLDKFDFFGGDDILHRLSQTSAVAASQISAVRSRLGDFNIFARWPSGTAGHSSNDIFAIVGNVRCQTFTTAVSSRLGRALDQHREWFAALLTFCTQLSPNDCLLASPGQFTFRFLRRIAELFAIPSAILLQTSIDRFAKGLDQALSLRESAGANEMACILRVVANEEQLLQVDECVSKYCAEVRALNVRANGNIQRLITERLVRAKTEPEHKTLILTATSGKMPKH